MPRRDVCFLTGPNMAGKSTYMKTLGMAVYLAHEGVQKGKIPPCRIGYLISVSNRDTNKSKVSEKDAFFFCYAARLLSIFIFKTSLVFSIISFGKVILQK